ncbi:MAG TPA: hypothetical protein VFU37_05945 [Pyrinomonadaceae bacterium]|nr:hypothetical protein [Pyrinomonadaceae bacterium]
MARFKHPLDRVKVAAPCKADWDQMIGSERVRFCAQCNLNVYNLSGMTRTEAESLIARNEQRLCVRFFRRRDGSIITRDCPEGLRLIRRRVSYFIKAVFASVVTFLLACGFQSLVGISSETHSPEFMGIMLPGKYDRTVRSVSLAENPETVMGDIALPPLHPKRKTRATR